MYKYRSMIILWTKHYVVSCYNSTAHLNFFLSETYRVCIKKTNALPTWYIKYSVIYLIIIEKMLFFKGLSIEREKLENKTSHDKYTILVIVLGKMSSYFRFFWNINKKHKYQNVDIDIWNENSTFLTENKKYDAYWDC